MAHIVWTPWRDLHELLTVRRQLYPSAGVGEPDMRRKACSQISAWKLRGNLPHAVESTWFLTDAVMTDNINSNQLTPLAVRACYTTAFCRFVTGLVDSDQDSKFKASMYQKATKIGLPASFVELRHEATHGDLPSLIVLRRAAERALEWLYNDYWIFTGVRTGNLDEDDLSAFKDGREKLKEKFRSILQLICSEAGQVTENKNQAGSQLPTRTSEEACLELAGICKGEKLAIAELVKVLLEYDMLVPSSHIIGRNMDEIYPIWDRLLQQLALRQERFLTTLTDEMAVQIISPSLMDVTIDPYREVITNWLMHIYTSKQWGAMPKQSKLEDDCILSTCLQNPNHWTLKLATTMINTPDRKLAKETYGERVLEAVAEQLKPKDHIAQSISTEYPLHLLPSQRAWLETQEGLQEQERSLQENILSLGEDAEVRRWEKLKEGWIAKPIGLV